MNRRLALSGALFAMVLVGPGLNDLRNLAEFWGSLRGLAPPGELQRGVDHGVFHALTPTVGLTLAALILALAVLAGPYRRGERWAWWALAGASLARLAANVWGTLFVYAHGVLGGLVVELEIPLVLWVAAVALSWRDVRPLARG